MPSTKEIAIDFIRELPEDLSIEEIAYKLYLNDKIDRARQQIESGQHISLENAKDRMKKWLE
ncbi:MAG: hypothetical protein JW891_18620 [Candidatus Lokiarchaeota archaeon]|nr:hypothetical protein [Candidatus Lokiarchaeota archaeon]